MAPPKHYAARLNAFKIGADAYWPGKNRVTTIDILERAASAGLNAADLNFPDHLQEHKPAELRATMDGMGVELNGPEMYQNIWRCYSQFG